MSTERYVVLGLSDHAAPWFRDLSHWATDSVLPVEFVKCRSAAELRAQVESGRRWSAIVVDGAVAGTDRDLLALGRRVNAALIVVDRLRAQDWGDLGADAVLDEPVTPEDWLAALTEHATQVLEPERRLAPVTEAASAGWQAPVVAVLGPGGAGTSTVTMAVAQGLAAQPLAGGSVVLIDFARAADQAFLHDVGDLVPGLPELVEAHRLGPPTPARLADLFHHCPDRHYDLLLGLRRPREWSLLRPQALEAAFESIRSRYRFVVADADADLEGEVECGSIDVEERNGLARSAALSATVVVTVGLASPKGLHALVRCIETTIASGVDPGALLPVVNRASRSARARAAIAGALADLTASIAGADQLAGPVFLSERRRLDDGILVASPLPEALTRPMTAAVLAHLDRRGAAEPRAGQPTRVARGALGHLEAQPS